MIAPNRLLRFAAGTTPPFRRMPWCHSAPSPTPRPPSPATTDISTKPKLPATAPVRTTDTAVAFSTTLTAGSHQLAPVFQNADGHEVGAYYAVVTNLP